MRHHSEGTQILCREILFRPEIPYHAVIRCGQGKVRLLLAEIEKRERMGAIGERLDVELRVLEQGMILVVRPVFGGAVRASPSGS